MARGGRGPSTTESESVSDPAYRDIGSVVIRVIEECAELQQALCKAERFGWFNGHPDYPTRTNLDDVKSEMDDVVGAIERLEEHLRDIKAAQFGKPG